MTRSLLKVIFIFCGLQVVIAMRWLINGVVFSGTDLGPFILDYA